MDKPNVTPPKAGDDPFRHRLRRAAMEERPAFSLGLHRQIAERLKAETRPGRSRLQIGLWPAAAAAAAAILLLASTPLVYRWISTSRGQLSLTTAPRDNGSHATTKPIEQALARTDEEAGDQDGGNLISARLWPPALIVRLPLPTPVETSSVAVESSPEPPPTLSLPGSPRWLLSALQMPEDRALSSVREAIPQQLRPLLQGQQTNLQ